MTAPRLAVGLLAAGLAAGCSNPERDRLEKTTRATYDQATGRLKEITYDANKNGRVDTWTEMDGSRPVRARVDRNEDGKLDRWEYYDDNGRLTKVGFSRSDDGTPDAWAFSDAESRVVRVEISSLRDAARIDRWERYDPPAAGAAGAGPLAAVEEDTNADGRPDKWETYERGALKTAAFDANHDGTPDRRLTYEAGGLVLIETEPDGAGRFARQVRVK